MVFDYLEWPDAKNACRINQQAYNLISKIPWQYKEYDRWEKDREKAKRFWSDRDPLPLFLDIHWEQFLFPHIPKPDFQKHNHNDHKCTANLVYNESRIQTLRVNAKYPYSRLPKTFKLPPTLQELDLSNSYVDQLPSNLSWRCHVVFGDRSKFSRSARAIRWIQETISRCLNALAVFVKLFLKGAVLTLPFIPVIPLAIVTKILTPILLCTSLSIPCSVLLSFVVLIVCIATLALLAYLLNCLFRILEAHINRFLQG